MEDGLSEVLLTQLVNNMTCIHLKCIINATEQATQFCRPHWNLKSKKLVHSLQQKHIYNRKYKSP